MISQSEKTNPISQMAKMNVSLNTTKDYGNFRLYGPKKTNPIQTQSKPVLSAVEREVEWVGSGDPSNNQLPLINYH